MVWKNKQATHITEITRPICCAFLPDAYVYANFQVFAFQDLLCARFVDFFGLTIREER